MPNHTPPALHPADELNARLFANCAPPDWVNPTAADGYNLVVIGGGLNNPRPLTAVTRFAQLPAYK